jgi:hypothetical protein
VLMPKGYKVHGYIANEKWKYETWINQQWLW